MSAQVSGEGPIPSKKIRVVLADNHREVTTKVQTLLRDEFEILDVVQDGNQAVRTVLTMDPDVLVIDISMPIMDGLQATRTILGANSHTRVIFLTIHEGGDYIGAAFSAGGMAYVTKRHLATDLVDAIRETVKGHTFVSNSIRM
jgi:DNA-binding NarL/FixJ family response regulator